jgi:FMN reductase
LTITVVVGNPKPASRTLRLAVSVADALSAATGIARGLTLDLASVASILFEWPNDKLAALNEEVARSTIVVFGSPTYKAAYTGMLKAFLDRYSSGALKGVIAIPVMTGASDLHAMAPDTSLRPLLVELGASAPTSAVYFVTSNMDALDAAVATWLGNNQKVANLWTQLKS